MKKLAIAAVAVAFAAAIQAATVDWGVNLVLQDANFEDVQGTVTFFLTSDLDTPLANSPLTLSGGAVDGVVTGDDQTSWTARVTISNFDGQTASYYIDYVFDMDTVTHAGYADADTYLSGLSNSVNGGLLNDYTLDLYSDPASQGFTKVQNVPEPTTVALLALGLAAVGRKRKVA